MSIFIKNTSLVKNESEKVISETFGIQSVQESIEEILNGLNQYWNQNQEDQQKFAKGLADDVNFLKNICDCNKEFSNSIINYMEVTENISKRTV